MSHRGDVSQGKALFFDDTRLACSRCHEVEAVGENRKVGPPLFAAGDKFGRRDLIESVLAPSASIAVGYSTTTVRTRSGEMLQGVVRIDRPPGRPDAVGWDTGPHALGRHHTPANE